MKYSIITVVYNSVELIEKTIQSVINQTEKDYEYIIIDGKSNDGTVEMIRKYQQSVSYYLSEPDNGIYDAMNKGIAVAKGEYISFINAGDWYEKDALSIVNKELTRESHPIVYGKVRKIINGDKQGYIGISGEYCVEKIHFENLYCHQGLFIRKDMFEKIGYYNVQYKILADYEWILKAHNQSYNPYYIDYDVANYLMGGTSCITNCENEKNRIIIEHFRMEGIKESSLRKWVGMAEFEMLYSTNKKIFSKYFENFGDVYIWGIGHFGREIYDILVTNKVKVKSIIDKNPNDIGLYKNTNIIKSSQIKEEIKKIEKPMTVIITPFAYEKEIKAILDSINSEKVRIIKISDIFNWSYIKYHMTKIDC